MAEKTLKTWPKAEQCQLELAGATLERVADAGAELARASHWQVVVS